MSAAPKMPAFNPTSILQGIGDKVQDNLLQIAIIGALCAVTTGYLLFLIWQEYKRNPLKFKVGKVGKMGFKIGDFIRKK